MEYDYNTSALVRDALPDTIERPNKKSIRILKYDRDTRDTYEDVRHVSREICSGESSIYRPVSHSDQEKDPKHSRKVRVDLIVHLGMVALGWRPDQFRFETVARRDGYELAGDDGKHVDSAGLKSLGLPESLATSLDVQAAWTKVKDKFPVRLHLPESRRLFCHANYCYTGQAHLRLK